MTIKKLCLANCDEYDNVYLDLEEEVFLNAVEEKQVICIYVDNKQIHINTEFIVSFEL